MSQYNRNITEYLTTQSSGKLLTQLLPTVQGVTVNQGGIKKIVPMKDSYTRLESLATNSYRPSSNFNNGLFNQGPIDIEVKMATISGKAYEMIITFQIQNNTGAPVEVAPIQGWFSRIEFLLGTNVIQQFFPEDLFNYLYLLDLNEYTRVSDLMGLDDRYLPRRDLIANGDIKEYILIIPNNFLKETGIIGQSLNQSLIARLYMAGPSETIVSGNPPQINDIRVQIITNHLTHESLTAAINTQKSMGFCTRYYWPVRQLYNQQNIGPSTTLDYLLSSFNGLFNAIMFSITPINAVGLDRYTDYPVRDFDILDENGMSIFGNAARQTTEESSYWDSSITNPLSNMTDTKNLYIYPMTTQIKQDLVNGTCNGVYYFNGRARLSITTDVLRIAKIITISQAGALVAAAGQYRILYTAGTTGIIEATPYLAWNANAAAIKAAIEALPTFQKFQQTVTVSNSLDNAPITISYDIDRNLGYDEADDKAILLIDSNVRDAAPLILNYNSVITQQPQDGWFGNPANFTITIMGTQLSCLDINEQGTTNIQK